MRYCLNVALTAEYAPRVDGEWTAGVDDEIPVQHHARGDRGGYEDMRTGAISKVLFILLVIWPCLAPDLVHNA